MNYTKGDWIYQNAMTSARNNYDILQKGGFKILATVGNSTGYSKEEEANAERIIQCVNSHDDLLEASKNIYERLNGKSCSFNKELIQLRQAIRKAREK